MVLIELGDPNLKEERFRALIDDMSVTKDVCATPAAVTKPSDALTPVHEPPVTKRVRFKLPEDVSSHMDEPAALLPRLVPQMA